MPFAVMHLGKAELETLGSIIAAIALGILSVRTRSFLYGALIHATVAIWMDWLASKHALLGS
jgi:membrane protease YdiL (CAAX protease family)